MPKRPKAPKLEEVEFDFIKSNFFRVIKADGAFGGLAPNGTFHMALYSERVAIPTKIFHEVEAGGLGPEIREKRQVRKAIVRELEVDVAMDIAQVIVLRNWLNEKIAQFQQIIGPLPESAPSDKKSNGKGPKK